MTAAEIANVLRRCSRESAARRIDTPRYRSRALTEIEPPRADVRRVDSATRAFELPSLIEQRELITFVDDAGVTQLRFGTAARATRHKGRLGQGERLMSREPRMGDGVRKPVTIKLAEFTRNGTIRRGQCVTVETVSHGKLLARYANQT